MPRRKTQRSSLGLFAILAILLVAAAVAGYLILSSQNASAPPSPTPGGAGLRVDFLDVGQADCTLVQVDGKAMLIDAGSNSTAQAIPGRLRTLGASRLDVVIGTHPDEDHIGGLDVVINQMDIGKIYMPNVSSNTRTFEDVLKAIQNKGLLVDPPVAGSTFALGSAQCTILAPNSASYEDTNNYSIVVRVVYGNTSFLFTGDAEGISEREMLNKGYPLRSDVLKVGHHGSSSSTSAAFLQAVSPKYAVISVGKDNPYGHPHQSTLDKLNAAGVQIYRTDLNGTITFRSNGGSLTITKEK